VDAPDFTDADMSRVALSSRLQELSESLRLAVAMEDNAPGEVSSLSAHLWSLLESELPLLQQAIVSYAIGRGGSWREIADLAGLAEGDARSRWAAPQAQRPGDVAALTAALDSWYVKHAQVEPLARVRDPFSRLLSGHTPCGRDCLICGKYEGRAVPAWAGFPRPPGGHLIDDGMWRVGHGPTPYWPAGTLLIESHRHFLDYADFEPAEAATPGTADQAADRPAQGGDGSTADTPVLLHGGHGALPPVAGAEGRRHPDRAGLHRRPRLLHRA